jgi:hypothetical protein
MAEGTAAPTHLDRRCELQLLGCGAESLFLRLLQSGIVESVSSDYGWEKTIAVERAIDEHEANCLIFFTSARSLAATSFSHPCKLKN